MPALPEPLTLPGAYRRFSPYVARIGIRILGWDDEEIDDLVQDVFTEAAAGIDRLRGGGEATLKGWLATVTVRVAVRRLRARRLRRLIFLDPGRRRGDPACPGASPEQRALVARVYQMLSRLPPKQHVAWILRHVEGESLEEVARHCECSLATAKRLLAAAEAWIERRVKHDPT